CREGRPAVLAIHDLHWADHGTLDVLEHLVGLLDDGPLMLAATSRATPDARDREFRERVRRERPGAAVDVTPGALSDDHPPRRAARAPQRRRLRRAAVTVHPRRALVRSRARGDLAGRGQPPVPRAPSALAARERWPDSAPDLGADGLRRAAADGPREPPDCPH